MFFTISPNSFCFFSVNIKNKSSSSLSSSMATDKFAIMLHRNTNKIILIFIYDVLKLIMIILLLNLLSSYLIMKFAYYFALKRPRLWCSKLDQISKLEEGKTSYKGLLCEAHAAKISKSGYRGIIKNCLESSKISWIARYVWGLLILIMIWLLWIIKEDLFHFMGEVDWYDLGWWWEDCGKWGGKFYSSYFLIKSS